MSDLEKQMRELRQAVFGSEGSVLLNLPPSKYEKMTEDIRDKSDLFMLVARRGSRPLKYWNDDDRMWVTDSASASSLTIDLVGQIMALTKPLPPGGYSIQVVPCEE